MKFALDMAEVVAILSGVALVALNLNPEVARHVPELFAGSCLVGACYAVVAARSRRKNGQPETRKENDRNR